MRITAAAIRYRTSVLVLMVLVLLGGLWSYIQIPKEANPQIEIPLITVATPFPGASPEEIESLVTFPLEQELQGIEGVDEIRSVSREGLSFVFVEFATGVSLTDANQRVRDRVDQALADLPDEAERPLVREFNIEDIPVLTVNLLARYSLAELTDLAERLQDEIEALPGVLEVQLTGGVTREVQVLVNLTALQAYGLTFQEIAQTIEQENTSLPGGTIDVDEVGYQIRVDGRFIDPAIIGDLVVRAPDQRPVYIRDVAEVIPMGFADRTSFSRLRVMHTENAAGETLDEQGDRYFETVSLDVTARAGQNVIELTETVRSAVESYTMPTGTQVVYTGDRSEDIRLLVEEMENHIIFGVVLVTFSLLFFLGLRTALIAAISIPLTMMLTFIVFFAMGETLNFIILFGLIVVLGILVDFSIVVVENIQVQVERGKGPWEAARGAVEEVGWPVTAGLTTTAVVFVPLLFWEGIVGEYMKYLPMTLIITLSSALVVALIMVPVAAGYLLPNDDLSRAAKVWPRRIGLGVLVFVVLVLLLANPLTVVALLLISVVVWVLYRYALAPGTEWFREHALPAAETWYRQFLIVSLRRDYSVNRPFVRNTGALAAISAGAVLLLLGAVVNALLGQVPAMVAVIPGGLLFAVGALGVLGHSLEVAFLGGRASVKVGAVFALVHLPFAVVHLIRGELTLGYALLLFALPLVIVLAGFLGMVFRPRGERLMLTDNRARVLNATVGTFLAVAILYGLSGLGGSFMPPTDPSQIRITLELPSGTNVEASNRVANQAIERLDRLFAEDDNVRRNVESVLVNVGVTGGGPWGGTEPDPRRARITMTMVDYPARAESSRRTIEKVRDVLDRFPAAIVSVEQDQMGPPTDPPFVLEITGPEFDRVAEIAEEVELRLRRAQREGDLDGLVDLVNTLETGRPELRVRIDRERASIAGLSTADIAATVRAAVEGQIAGGYREGEDEYDIRVRLREEDRQTLQSLEALTLVTEDARVPLLAAADLELESGPGTINRVNLRPVASLEGEIRSGFSTSEVIDRAGEVVAPIREDLPEGFEMRFAGEAEEQEDAFGFLGLALILGVGLMALVLITKFNAVVVPIIILLAVGLTMSGVILGLIATQSAFSLMTFLAVISLAGIVADDDIVMSEFILKYMDEGQSPEDAIVEGGSSRFRQVTLTAVTTIIGLIPLTIGFHVDFQGLLTELSPGVQFGSENAQFWGPLGAAVIAGLPAATAVTLLVVPVLYSVTHSLRGRLARL
jgi:multidrug efflux pump